MMLVTVTAVAMAASSDVVVFLSNAQFMLHLNGSHSLTVFIVLIEIFFLHSVYCFDSLAPVY